MNLYLPHVADHDGWVRRDVFTSNLDNLVERWNSTYTAFALDQGKERVFICGPLKR